MGMHTTKVAVGEGKFALEAQLTVTPRGMAVYACSPEFAHLGATAQAIPRPEPGRTATVSILAVPCHRDEIPAHDIAAALATRFGVPVVASTGFHVEQASGDDLQRVLDTTKELIAALGKLSVKEIRTIVWLVIAIALWLTVSGDYIGWVTLAIGVALAMPIIGEVLTPASWNAVDIKSLMFLTAAMAVGSVGGATGMNAWIADVVLPSSVPENIFLFALLVAALSMIIHMFMGSVMAVLGVCVPAFISFAAGSSVSPLAVALIVFTSINIHYILPFHNLPILIGEGKDAGGYTSKEAMRMGIPLTAVVFVVVLVEAAWFHLFGLM